MHLILKFKFRKPFTMDLQLVNNFNFYLDAVIRVLLMPANPLAWIVGEKSANIEIIQAETKLGASNGLNGLPLITL